MRLLITTQAVDRHDPTLGFFHRWLIEFAKHAESIEVICLYEGEHDLPEHVHVHSLGKEKGARSPLTYAFRFTLLSMNLRNDYDEVFVHMNPEYVILGGPFWKLTNKRIGLWYLHKSVDLKLRIAEWFADVIYTASKESFRLPSKKIQIVGHGIDTDLFFCKERNVRSEIAPLRLMTVGRVARAKNVHLLIAAAGLLAEKGTAVAFDILGAPVRAEDRAYAAELAHQIKTLPPNATVTMLGAKDQDEVAKLLCDYDLFIHASTGTGSVDKAVLEAVSSGLPAISTSEAFKELLSPFELFVPSNTPQGIADAITQFQTRTDRESLRDQLRETVVENYSLAALIPRILGLLAIPQKHN
jgi:glycosyltransferase involved in cell wall biosynthesis